MKTTTIMKKMIMNTSMKSVFKHGILMMSLLASMAVLISCGDDEGGEDPVDPVDPDPSTVVVDFTATQDPDDFYIWSFTNESEVFGIDDLTATYAWDFGDNVGTSDEENPTYTYTEGGDFTVELTVTAADGVSSSATESISVIIPANKYVSLFDQFGTGNTNADGNNDNGELRLQLEDSIRTGRVTFMYRLPIDQTEGYMNVAGTSTTSDFSVVELRIKSDPLAEHGWREGAGAADEIDGANFPTPKFDEWVPVEISWVADGVNYPKFTVVMDGQTVVTDIASATDGGSGDEAGHLEATKDGIKNLQWKFGSSSAIETDDAKRFHVDEIVVYSSDSGTETVVFEDAFQTYDVGTAWTDTDTEEEAAPYHVNSVDAEVVEEAD